MNFIDLAAQQRLIAEKLNANIAKVLAHGQYINGPEVRELENALAVYVGVRHAVGCASGTDALLMALMALEIGPGDAVFTTPFTFIATAEVISLLGAMPVFVDIDPVTFNIDPAKLALAIQAVKSNDPTLHPIPLTPHSSPLTPRCVIPVDLFGLPADYDEICAVAARHDLLVIEDAAQSFGGEYKGKKACAFGKIACTSFFPAKPLGCYGDGGMCFTSDDCLDEALRSIRVHGQGDNKYDNVRIGINGRLDTLQAAILMAKFEIFPEEIELRQEVAARYNKLLSGAVVTPAIPDGYRSAWAQYSILARDTVGRATLMEKLKAAGIPTAVYYKKPLHRQTAFAGLGYREGDFPASDDCARRILSLPMHPYLAADDQRRIADILRGESGK
ncbi:MAG: DegT/DnrJ/EryC1/StrS family aminotransferase [Proteobacteria bacterium]|nr:DegT/DnrJ/EryC1/StrS family aminotransferase [Pseudomonadota bacterium]MBU4120004.1 DegT/DnrJ/EryC1/StrS family aminotransferase [Pseudomonadota bacterium]